MVFWIGTGIIRWPHDKKQKANKITIDQKTNEEKALLGGALIGMMLLPLIYVFSPWLDFANYSLALWLEVIGIVLIPIALWLFYRAHKDLGLNWSPTLEMREEHTLVTKGVYSKMRHPMYTAIWLWVILQALLLQNYIAGLAGIVTFGLLYFLRVPKEEKMMLSQFGTQYEQYMNSTNRLIPKF